MPRRDKFTDSNRGPLAEWVIAYILNSWKRSKKIWEYYQLKELDPKGVDFLIILKGGISILVQVKSSRAHINNHHLRYPAVPFLYVVENFPKSEIDINIIELVEDHFRSALNDFTQQSFHELANGSKKFKAVK